MDAQSYFDADLQFIVSVPPDERTTEIYAGRNILFYTWLYQYRNACNGIPEAKIYQVVGLSISMIITLRLKELRAHGFMFRDESAIWTLSEEMYTVLTKFCNREEFKISQKITRGSFTGDELIANLCLLDGHSTSASMTEKTAQSLVQIMRGNIIHEPMQLDEVDFAVELLTGPDNSWHCLLIVYCSPAALSSEKVDHILSRISLIRESQKLIGTNAWLIAPAVDELKDVKMFAKHPLVHYMWSLSALRFMHLLAQNINDSNEKAIDMARKFPVIFEAREAVAFGAKEAMAALEKKTGASS